MVQNPNQTIRKCSQFYKTATKLKTVFLQNRTKNSTEVHFCQPHTSEHRMIRLDDSENCMIVGLV